MLLVFPFSASGNDTASVPALHAAAGGNDVEGYQQIVGGVTPLRHARTKGQKQIEAVLLASHAP